jgi:urease accessory protein
VTSGSLRLRASRVGAETILTDVYRTAPFHPGPVHRRDGIAEVMLQGVGPGIFPGDRLSIDVVVEAGATLSVIGQGATKLYPAPDGHRTESRTSLRVGAGSTLWWLPGELIPFRDAEFVAMTTACLAEGSKIALLEIITPGRIAMGERHRYRRLDLRLRIDVAGQPRLVDRALLDRREHRADAFGRHGAFPCAGSLVLVGYPKPDVTRLRDDGCWIGADGDERLAVVRGLGLSASALRGALLAILGSVARGPRATP